MLWIFSLSSIFRSPHKIETLPRLSYSGKKSKINRPSSFLWKVVVVRYIPEAIQCSRSSRARVEPHSGQHARPLQVFLRFSYHWVSQAVAILT